MQKSSSLHLLLPRPRTPRVSAPGPSGFRRGHVCEEEGLRLVQGTGLGEGVHTRGGGGKRPFYYHQSLQEAKQSDVSQWRQVQGS